MKRPFDRCPRCGGELATKQVEKLLRGGNNTAVVRAEAEVCLQCGERFYTDEVIGRFERICEELQQQHPADLTPIGRTFKSAS